MIQTRRIASGADFDWGGQFVRETEAGEGFFERFVGTPRLFYPQQPDMNSLVCCASPTLRVMLLTMDGLSADAYFRLNGHRVRLERSQADSGGEVVYKFMLESMVDNIVEVKNWDGSATKITAHLLKT